MNKIIEAAKQALETARCQHKLIRMTPNVKNPAHFDKWYCDKCCAIFYHPKNSASQQDTQT